MLAKRVFQTSAVLSRHMTMLFCAGLFGSTVAHAANEVLVVTQGGALEVAMKKNFFDPFEKQTGIKVVLVPNDYGKLFASIKAGKPDVDVSNIVGALAGSWQRQGVMQPIDYSKFDEATLKALPERLKQEFMVGAYTYSNGMAYNLADFPADQPRPQNWSDFWNVAEFPGPRGLSGCNMRLMVGGTLEFATLASGVPVEKLYPIDIDKALAKVKELQPDVGRFWDQYAEVTQALIAGDIAISPNTNGRVYLARKQNAPIDWNWNQSLLQQDFWMVSKGSPNAENAMKLIAFMLQAENQAGYARDTGFGPTNQDAFKLLSAEEQQQLPGSPDNIGKQILQNNDWWGADSGNGKTNLDTAMEKCVAALAR